MSGQTNCGIFHTVEYHSAIKRNKLIHKTIWMKLKSIMLSERSQIQLTPYHLIPFIWKSRKGKTIGTADEQLLGTGGSGERSDCKWGLRTFRGDGMFCILIMVVVTWLCIYQNVSNCTLKMYLHFKASRLYLYKLLFFKAFQIWTLKIFVIQQICNIRYSPNRALFTLVGFSSNQNVRKHSI